MTIEHRNIPDAQRHEPKGAATATVNQVYVADGSASGAWAKLPQQGLLGISANGGENAIVTSDGAGGFRFGKLPFGSFSFVNIASPFSVTYPSVYTKVAAITVAGAHLEGMSASLDGILTYTGGITQHFHIAATVSLSQSAGANRDIRAAVFKNGVLIANSETIQTTTSAEKVSTAIHTDVMMSTSDTLEIYVKNDGAGGDVLIYGAYLFAVGML